jgi:hypothetical protein
MQHRKAQLRLSKRVPVESGPTVMVAERVTATTPAQRKNLGLCFFMLRGMHIRVKLPVHHETASPQSHARIHRPARDIWIRWQAPGHDVPQPGADYPNKKERPHFGIAPGGEVWQFLDLGWATPVADGGPWRDKDAVVVIENLSKTQSPTDSQREAVERLVAVIKRVYGVCRQHRDTGWGE